MTHHAYTVLNGLMSHGKETWLEFGGLLTPEMFGGDSRAIFRTIQELYAADRLVDAVTVTEKIGSEYHDLVRDIATQHYSALPTFGAQIKELTIATNENRARDIGAQLQDSGDYDAARAALDTIGDTSAKEVTVDGHTALKSMLDDLQSKIDQDTVGLTTGLYDLDKILSGLVPSNLVLIAGRPSMGKTALAMNIAEHVRTNHCPVLTFSLEMSTEELTGRRTAGYGVDAGRLKTPKHLTAKDWENITSALGRMHDGNDLFINDIGGLSIGALESEARRMVKQHGVGMIVVDYLQLVTCKAERRLEEVSEVSRRLKALAKNLKIPVIALCQLNRQLEGVLKPVPGLHMLRESGQLEQDADVVIFVDRPEHRIETDRPGEADLVVAKNRNGKTGTAYVAWQGHYQRFVNLDHDWYPKSASA